MTTRRARSHPQVGFPALRLDSPLARRNPTVKLALLFVVSVAVLWVLDPITPVVLCALAGGAICAGAGLRWGEFARALVPFVAFGAGVLMVNALSRPGTVLWSGSILRVTTEGLSVGAALAGRTLLTGMLAVAFIVTTDAVALMTSLHHHAKLDVRVTYALVSGLRMLQQMGGEWRTIRWAQAVRAPLDRKGRPRGGVRAFMAAGFVLLAGAIRRGERVAVTLESRGLGRRPRTTWRPAPLERMDAVFAGVVVAVLALVLVVAGLMGVLRGPGALW